MRGMMDGSYIGESGIYARLYRPDGPASCPLVVLFHGFPGNEQNADIAYALREAGYAVLTPYYNGCWGSKGDYRLETIPDNVRTVLDYARCPEWAAGCGIDTTRIGVVGHSLGGWAALITPRIAPGLRAIVALDPLVDSGFVGDGTDISPGLRDWLEESRQPLANVTVEQLVAGFRWADEHWHPLSAVGHLGQTALAVICASGKDAVDLQPALRLIERARDVNPSTEFWVLNSDHSFVSERPLLRDLVVRFIQQHLG